MRDPNRIGPVLEQVRQVWEGSPDLRLSQVVFAAARLGDVPFPEDPFYAEDDRLLIGLAEMKRTKSQPLAEWRAERELREIEFNFNQTFKEWRRRMKLVAIASLAFMAGCGFMAFISSLSSH
jgi:hypothetical protein